MSKYIMSGYMYHGGQKVYVFPPKESGKNIPASVCVVLGEGEKASFKEIGVLWKNNRFDGVASGPRKSEDEPREDWPTERSDPGTEYGSRTSYTDKEPW